MPVYLQIACVDTFGLLGASFKNTSFDKLELLVLLEASQEQTLVELRRRWYATELVYLATCNRVELVYLANEEIPSLEFKERLCGVFHGVTADFPFYHHRGENAVRHLFRVATSLDSMVVGETQILGQVKTAFEESKAKGLCSVRMEELFSWAFRTAKKVRRETALGEGAVSIANLVVDEVLRAWRSAVGYKVVLVGIGEMTVKLARLLAERGIKELHFVNRTAERAELLAQPYGASFQGLADFFASPPPTSIIVSATSAPEPIFTRRTIGPLLNAHPILLVDLAVPKDVAVDVQTIPAVTVRRLEDFRAKAAENLAARQREVARGEEIVAADACRFWERFVESERLGYLRNASVFDLAV